MFANIQAVHAFENHLRVVDALLKADVHNHEFLDAPPNNLDISLGDLLGEETEVFDDSIGSVCAWLFAIYQGH